MDPHIRRAIEAIDDAERAERDAPPFEITAEHWRAVERLMALPQNQDGADKSLVWRVHVYCWNHFRNAKLVP
ncbi:MAG: hypothetical protein WAT39_20920 [Planctomycetota bacterium]